MTWRLAGLMGAGTGGDFLFEDALREGETEHTGDSAAGRMRQLI